MEFEEMTVAAGARILVTGADGFIGSHLVEVLVRSGYKVRAFVYYNSFNSWGWLDHCDKDVQDNFEVFAGDIRDPYGVRKAMEDCEAVLHLAALISIPYSYHSPETYIETNIKGTLNVLQAAHEYNVSHVIHTSTSEVYGTARYVPMDENHPVLGQSPYSASKIGADQLAYSFHSSFNLPVTIIRPFNTYGPRQSLRAVIPTIISQFLAGESEISIGSITPTRDFNFVADTVSGFIAALENSGGVGEVINLGSNFEISIKDTALMIAKIFRVEVSFKTESNRIRPNNSEVERLWASNEKAKDLLNWSPKYGSLNGLQKGLETTIEWFTLNKRIYEKKFGIYNL